MARVVERLRSKKYLRSAKNINVGDKFVYVSNGFEVSDGGEVVIVSKGAEYDAEVVQVTEHMIVMNILVDQSTINRPCIWEPKPYNWAIRKVDIGRSEKLYLYA